MADNGKPKKLNKVEAIKKNQNGLDVWRDIEEYATTGFDSIPEEKFELFKWYGLYQQKPKAGHFMMRVRMPGGRMTVEQARTCAQISREFGRGTLDITTRQNFQIHWLTIEMIPEIVRRLHRVGMSTTMACGDAPRTPIGCPMSGRLPDEVVDAHPVLAEYNRKVLGNRLYSDLPRKFKTSVSGCHERCALPEINDIGLYGALKDGQRGFNLLVGGGLSNKPFIATGVNAWVPYDKAVEVMMAITEIFRDHGFREKRAKARLKFLVQDWGAMKFRETLEAKLGWTLDPAVSSRFRKQAWRDHLGIMPQKQQGKLALGFCSTSGRISPEDLFVAADIAEKYGSGELANTNMQNLIVMDVDANRLSEAQEMAIHMPTLTLEPTAVRAGMVVCTGTQFCNLAVVETKNRSYPLLDALEREFPELERPIKIAISGCPSSCGQHQTGDIGLRGARARVDGELVEGFDIHVAAEPGPHGELGTPYKKAVPADEIKDEVLALVRQYAEGHLGEESFAQFARRQFAQSYSI